ncbi:MAG: tetratricopeptide repeat protein, partial [Lysobacter sp.]|nr:tetratricopeptide repeat protein [Lysobacter sp.]
DEHPDEAIAKLQAAAQLESDTPKHAVTPGPTLPSEELLAQAYLASGQRAQAHDAYERALARYPNRRNAERGIAATASD